jgi:protein involved in temperature-dependent protein secretion
MERQVAFLYLGFVAIAILVGTLMWRMRRQALPPKIDPDSTEYFREQCQKLLETNKLDELVGYTRERIRKRPNHTYAHWYLARAFYLQQKWIEALRAFNEVARLDPSWIEDSVTPYVRAIEARIKPREVPVATDTPEQPRTLH